LFLLDCLSGTSFSAGIKTLFMNHNEKDPGRNRPSEEGTNNDPNVRDYSAQQPDVNTISTNENYAEENEDLTETASDGFTEDAWAEDADADFEDVDDEEDDTI
jgi:hypothetical protein